MRLIDGLLTDPAEIQVQKQSAARGWLGVFSFLAVSCLFAGISAAQNPSKAPTPGNTSAKAAAPTGTTAAPAQGEAARHIQLSTGKDLFLPAPGNAQRVNSFPAALV